MGKGGKRALRHIAIIMDGNGRWARQRGLPHIEGHKEGANAVRRTIEAAKSFGLEYLTLYAFSTENWKRPKEEVSGLMSLLRQFIDEHLQEIHEKGLRVKAIGRLGKIPRPTRVKLQRAVDTTKDNDKGTVVLALNYGGRAEIIDAVKSIVTQSGNGMIGPRGITEKRFRDYLYDPEIPDPDLLIRTSGELRISNFLLWQLAYAEIYVTQTLWPDFDEKEFKNGIDDFHRRERRFGGR